MFPRNLFAALAVLLLAACGPANGPTTAEIATSPELSAALTELTHAVRRYAAEKQKVPESLEEVAKAGYVKQLPEAPPGQRFVITPKRLEVVLQAQ